MSTDFSDTQQKLDDVRVDIKNLLKKEESEIYKELVLCYPEAVKRIKSYVVGKSTVSIRGIFEELGYVEKIIGSEESRLVSSILKTLFFKQHETTGFFNRVFDPDRQKQENRTVEEKKEKKEKEEKNLDLSKTTKENIENTKIAFVNLQTKEILTKNSIFRTPKGDEIDINGFYRRKILHALQDFGYVIKHGDRSTTRYQGTNKIDQIFEDGNLISTIFPLHETPIEGEREHLDETEQISVVSSETDNSKENQSQLEEVIASLLSIMEDFKKQMSEQSKRIQILESKIETSSK
jgi:hypothetical protein